MGSSDVNIIISILRFGLKPLSFSKRMASIAPITPTVPSYFPDCGMASVCEPVATAGKSGSDPFHLANKLPIASVRISSPAFSNKSDIKSLAWRSFSVKRTLVTAGKSVSENLARFFKSQSTRTILRGLLFDRDVTPFIPNLLLFKPAAVLISTLLND